MKIINVLMSIVFYATVSILAEESTSKSSIDEARSAIANAHRDIVESLKDVNEKAARTSDRPSVPAAANEDRANFSAADASLAEVLRGKDPEYARGLMSSVAAEIQRMKKLADAKPAVETIPAVQTSATPKPAERHPTLQELECRIEKLERAQSGKPAGTPRQ